MLRFTLKAVAAFLFVSVAAPIVLAEESAASEAFVAPQITATKQAANTAPLAKTATRKHRAIKKSYGKNRRVQASFNKRGKLVKKTVFVHGRRKVVYQRVVYAPIIPAMPSAGDLVGLGKTRDSLALKSSVAFVLDQSNAEVLFEKNSDVALPMASITKLMTGLVVVDAHQNMDEVLEVTSDDIDREKNSSSRLRVGARLTRANMLHIALMSSENRAASALGRNYPGGRASFVAAMNAKAKALGMNGTRYVDSSGLSSQNVATARDLAKLVIAAHQEPILRQYSTDIKYAVDTGGRRAMQFGTTNQLVKNPAWEIGLQKTGYISEAGRCLVMQANIEGRSVVMILLDSKGKSSRLGDASRIRKWLEAFKPQTASVLKQGAV